MEETIANINQKKPLSQRDTREETHLPLSGEVTIPSRDTEEECVVLD